MRPWSCWDRPNMAIRNRALTLQAEESLGMAMTFTIATAARDALQNAIERRIARLQAEDDARVKAYEDVSIHVLLGMVTAPCTEQCSGTYRCLCVASPANTPDRYGQPLTRPGREGKDSRHTAHSRAVPEVARCIHKGDGGQACQGGGGAHPRLASQGA